MTSEASPRLAAGWTLEAYIAHNEARVASDASWAARLETLQRRFDVERDRRYSEVNTEKEKALQIKDAADLKAEQLSRETQTYKDTQANELREQIASERGLYVTHGELTSAIAKIEATMAPILVYVATQQGRNQGIGLIIGGAVIIVGMMLSGVGLIFAFRS